MAVPKYKRKDNPLEVLNAASRVFKSAVALVKNENVVQKKNFKFIAEPMISNIREMMYSITIANHMRMDDAEQLRRRLQLQDYAREYAVKLMVDIQLVIQLANASDGLVRCDRLLKEVNDLTALIAGWRKITAAKLSAPDCQPLLACKT